MATKEERELVQIDKAQRRRIIALARERGECEEMINYVDGQLGTGNPGPTEVQALMDDRQRNHERVVAIIAEMDTIHAERVRLGLAS